MFASPSDCNIISREFLVIGVFTAVGERRGTEYSGRYLYVYVLRKVRTMVGQSRYPTISDSYSFCFARLPC